MLIHVLWMWEHAVRCVPLAQPFPELPPMTLTFSNCPPDPIRSSWARGEGENRWLVGGEWGMVSQQFNINLLTGYFLSRAQRFFLKSREKKRGGGLTGQASVLALEPERDGIGSRCYCLAMGPYALSKGKTPKDPNRLSPSPDIKLCIALRTRPVVWPMINGKRINKHWTNTSPAPKKGLIT